MIFNYINQFDYTLSVWAVNITQSSVWFRFFVYICAEPLIWVFALYLLYCWVKGKTGTKKMVLIAVMAVVLGTFVKTAINFFVLRPRPFVTHPELSTFSFYVDPISFPSGHSIWAFAIAVSLYISLRSTNKNKNGWLFLCGAILVALGRFFSGVHFFSDVFVGSVIGCLSAWYLHREASILKKYLPNE